jgi:hypothetical protein
MSICEKTITLIFLDLELIHHLIDSGVSAQGQEANLTLTNLMLLLLQVKVKSRSYIMTNGQSASLSWCQAPIWDP